LLTLIVGPSEESRTVGEKKKEMAERHNLRYNFWKALLERAKEKTKVRSQTSPQPYYGSLSVGAAKSGLVFKYSITQHEARVELYIDRGKDSEKENKAIFDQLFSHEEEIEKAFGESLIWERLDTKRACRISKQITLGGYRDQDKWPEIHEQMIDAMIRLEKALKPFIMRIKI